MKRSASTECFSDEEIRYLQLLSKKFPNKKAAKVEIVNLNAILELPRGTEHFVSDIHGEFEAFIHVLRNSSGLIRQIIKENRTLSLLGEEQENELATLIYYPKQRINLQKSICNNDESEMNKWYKLQIRRILIVLKGVTFKYTRSKVGKNLPKDYGYIISEMLTERIQGTSHLHQMVGNYFDTILDNVVKEKAAAKIIMAMSKVIQKLGVENLHILGDIYDRGPGAEVILDFLIESNIFVDITFGNHDVLWIGAASGCAACIANVIRISVRYSNTETLEEGYGISLNPLREFTKKIYGERPISKFFSVEMNSPKKLTSEEFGFLNRMEKAIFIIQLKLESQIIRNHPEYDMKERLLLSAIDYEKGTIKLKMNGKVKEYKLNDTDFPTIDPKNPDRLTKEEIDVVEYFVSHVKKCEKLHVHTKYLFAKGKMYLIRNENILYHASIPITTDFKFLPVAVGKNTFSGKALLDELDYELRKQYRKRGKYGDSSLAFWLWCGKDSPLFLKSKMATFERYFIEDKATWIEKKGFYYMVRNDQRLLDMIFKEFQVDKKKAHLIVGHVPVIEKRGDNPVSCNGKYITIDGGFSKAYQKVTGIAGYTLRADSQGLYLYVHKKFTSTEDAVRNFADLDSEIRLLEHWEQRVKDTDVGRELQNQVSDCRKLVKAYKVKLIKQQIIKTKVIRY